MDKLAHIVRAYMYSSILESVALADRWYLVYLWVERDPVKVAVLPQNTAQ